MSTYKFKKEKTKLYNIFTVISVIISVPIFAGLGTFISKEVAYLLFSILSYISIHSAIKKAGKEFEEIMFIGNDQIKFFFQNKLKEPIILSKSEMEILINEEFVEFNFLENKNLVGRAYKNRIEGEYNWENFLNNLD